MYPPLLLGNCSVSALIQASQVRLWVVGSEKAAFDGMVR